MSKPRFKSREIRKDQSGAEIFSTGLWKALSLWDSKRLFYPLTLPSTFHSTQSITDDFLARPFISVGYGDPYSFKSKPRILGFQ